MRLITTSLLGLVALSLMTLPPAHAVAWVGNDDGEFDWNCCTWPSYVYVLEVFNAPLHWTVSPPGNLVSLQYNPDRDVSWWNQNHQQWFQTGIISDNNGCATFTIQVYDLNNGALVWSSFYPGTGCITIGGILTAQGRWQIDEEMASSHMIDHTTFAVWTGGSSLQYTIYPPQNWVWVRSNICWCGTAGGTTTFDTGGGNSYMSSNVGLYAAAPPIDLSTAENSNMGYGCMQGFGSGLQQTFGLNGHC
jgi:hypothetical protein